MDKKKSTNNSEWLELYDYVKYSLLGYTENMKFPKYCALRLRGLAEGNFISNKKIKPNANYSLSQIYMTCKVCKPKIIKYFTDNTAKIKDERHKINIIMMFIEQEINDVVLRLEKQKKSEEKIDSINVNSVNTPKADYWSEQIKINKIFSDLW